MSQFVEYYIKEVYRTFYLFTGIVTYLRCWKNMRKVCESVPLGLRFRNFPRVLLISLVGYYVSKPIENVFYCLIILYLRRFFIYRDRSTPGMDIKSRHPALTKIKMRLRYPTAK